MATPGQPENAEFPGEFIPSASGKDCEEKGGGWGTPHRPRPASFFVYSV